MAVKKTRIARMVAGADYVVFNLFNLFDKLLKHAVFFSNAVMFIAQLNKKCNMISY